MKQTLTLQRVGNVYLYAPESYITASPEVRAIAVNGCGPGGWKVDLVPDTIWFLDISAACNIHDWMYTTGDTLADKEEADRVFLNNMLRLIYGATGTSGRLLRNPRRIRAWEYYEFVQHFGGPAFWENKNEQKNLIPASIAGIRG